MVPEHIINEPPIHDIRVFAGLTSFLNASSCDDKSCRPLFTLVLSKVCQLSGARCDQLISKLPSSLTLRFAILWDLQSALTLAATLDL